MSKSDNDTGIDARRFRRSIALVVAAPYVLMALLAATVTWQVLYVSATRHEVRRVEHVATQADRIREMLPDLETRVVEMRVAPGAAARASFERRMDAVQDALTQLHANAARDPAHLRFAADLQAMFDHWRAQTRALPDDATSRDVAAATAPHTEAVQARLAQFVRAERVRRGQLYTHARRATQWVVGSAVGLAVVLASVMGFLSRRQLLGVSATYNRALDATREHARALEARKDELKALLAERDALLAQVREALALRDEFLEIACHELRTPLTPLKMQVDGLARAAQGSGPIGREQLVARLANVRRGVDRVTRTVEQMLEISQFTAGAVELSLDEVNLSELVHDEVLRAGDALCLSGCTATVDARYPVLGRWDRDRLRQVVGSLLSNATKFGCQKPVEVTVTREGDLARIVVVDHGIGIRPADHDRIFQRFGRAVSERNYGGFGAGLWMSRTIVRAMGGTLGVRSEPGAGATFTVELPLRAAVDQSGAQRASLPAQTSAPPAQSRAS